MYEAGQWNVCCDRCGFQYKSRQLRKEWNGLRTFTAAAYTAGKIEIVLYGT